MSGPRNTAEANATFGNGELTTGAVLALTFGTSLLLLSTAGREAGSSESASAFCVQNGKRASRVA